MSTLLPSNGVHELAMLYLSKLDLSGLTPAQLLDKYLEVRDAIADRTMEIDSRRYKPL